VTAPRITGIIESALYVADMARSVDFYVRTLGLTPTSEPTGRLCALEVTACQVLLLFKRGASTEDKITPTGTIPGTDGAGPLHVTFGIAEGDLQKWRDHLHGLGVETVPKTWPEGGESLYFRDLDGHVVELKTSNWHGVKLVGDA